MTIITLSPKGQLTIPVSARKKLLSQKFLFEMVGSTITLTPVKIEPMQEKPQDELSQIHTLGEKSFDFWNNNADDAYHTYFLKQERHEV